MEHKDSVIYSPFYGCTIVATGKMEHFTRDGINSKIVSLEARELGIPVLTEQEFLSMIPA